MSPSANDRLANSVGATAALLCAGIALLITVWIGIEAIPAFQKVGITSLITDERWIPTSDREPQFGILPILGASFLVTIGAIIPAVILGCLFAIFEQFYVVKFARKWLRRILELLAGVPSVVLGFWGLVVLVPIIQKFNPPGQSLLAASIVLAIMIVPTVAITASSAFKNVPAEYFQAAAALGMGRARTIVNVVIPAARRGIAGGVVLAAARAIGETMAVVMVCGNIAQWPSSIFDPIRPVTAAIALEMGYATSGHRAIIFAMAFILIVVVGIAVCWLAFRKEKR